MARVRSRGNKSTELRLAALLRKLGLKGWRRNFPLHGRPDFVFPKARVAVFVDGDFWHGHPTHGRLPKSNRAFWRNKIARNRARDQTVNRRLRAMGWSVARVWEHELRQKFIPRVATRLRKVLGRQLMKAGK
jgi:DNA mismatch endonuclease (patch repair protein)